MARPAGTLQRQVLLGNGVLIQNPFQLGASAYRHAKRCSCCCTCKQGCQRGVEKREWKRFGSALDWFNVRSTERVKEGG